MSWTQTDLQKLAQQKKWIISNQLSKTQQRLGWQSMELSSLDWRLANSLLRRPEEKILSPKDEMDYCYVSSSVAFATKHEDFVTKCFMPYLFFLALCWGVPPQRPPGPTGQPAVLHSGHEGQAGNFITSTLRSQCGGRLR